MWYDPPNSRSPTVGFDPWAAAAARQRTGPPPQPSPQPQPRPQQTAPATQTSGSAAAQPRGIQTERPHRRGDLPRGSRQQTAVFRRAERLGLAGPIGGHDLGEAEGETAVARTLRLGALERARQTLDLDRLDTALTWFEEFVADAEREPLFKPIDGFDDVAAYAYNQVTLDMFGEYLRRRGSRLRGRANEPLRSDTVSTYVSAIKSLRIMEAHYHITDARTNTVAPAAAKRMRQLEGPPGERGLRRALRAAHMREAAAKGLDRRSKRGAIRWAAALLAHNLLLRGGELGVVDNAAFDRTRDLKIQDVEFRAPCAESSWRRWFIVYIVAIKDAEARHRAVPMVVQRRGLGGALGADPMDVYDAVVLAIVARTGKMPPSLGRTDGPKAAEPLFTRHTGGVWRTGDTRELAQEIAKLAGEDPTEFGAKSFRIGGATDWRAVFGPAAAETLIRERGRWSSDIARIYQRALVADHARGSAAVGDAGGRDLEALCRGWTQPASFR